MSKETTIMSVNKLKNSSEVEQSPEFEKMEIEKQ
ncbi:MAG: hypothetical protein JWN12_362 [Candidatus Saccharibacteria bacterium]|nr:hypothetical protein [Candidatus Saccharibacteria bacterium]